MDSEYKGSSTGGIESGVREEVVAVANRREMRRWDVVLRFLALVLSLAATVLLGVDKETKTLTLTLVPTLPPLNVPVKAKWHYLSAAVFFVVANAVACGYSAISLFLTLASRGGKKGITTLLIILFDLAMVALLFSSIGAVLAVGLIAYQGNSHVQWKKVCNMFDKFCNQAAVAMGLSAGATLVFFLLVVLATFSLHKKY